MWFWFSFFEGNQKRNASDHESYTLLDAVHHLFILVVFSLRLIYLEMYAMRNPPRIYTIILNVNPSAIFSLRAANDECKTRISLMKKKKTLQSNTLTKNTWVGIVFIEFILIASKFRLWCVSCRACIIAVVVARFYFHMCIIIWYFFKSEQIL